MNPARPNTASTMLTMLAIGGSSVLLILSIGGYFPQFDWRFELLGNPRPHFVLAAVLAGIWLLIHVGRKQASRWVLSIPIAVVLLNALALVPFYLGAKTEVDETGPSFSVLHLNTRMGEADLGQLADYEADIIFLQEVTPDSELLLEDQLPGYELLLSQPEYNSLGSAMLVARNTEVVVSTPPRIIRLPADNVRPLISTGITTDDFEVQVLSLHAKRPYRGEPYDYQQTEFDAVAEWASGVIQAGDDLVMIGDLNVTPWSRRFRRFADASQTKDSMVGFGIQPTWSPALVPMWMGLPIDTALASNGLAVADREAAPVAGSDHGLLFVRLAPAAEAADEPQP